VVKSIVVNTLEQSRPMKTIRVTLDKKLIGAADRAARQTNASRSALVHDALRENLRLETRAKEDRDREGYAKRPHAGNEAILWGAEAAQLALD
jgi:predicted transcriptional regulator